MLVGLWQSVAQLDDERVTDIALISYLPDYSGSGGSMGPWPALASGPHRPRSTTIGTRTGVRVHDQFGLARHEEVATVAAGVYGEVGLETHLPIR
jgi:hypothetical protein